MMKKLLVGFVVLLLIFVGVLLNTYIQAIKPFNNAKQDAIEIAKAKTDIVVVDDFQLFHGIESVSILKGTNKKGEHIIVWIPKNSEDIMVKKEANGISEKNAIKKVKQLSNPKKIIDVRLGMEKGIPLWEIYYLSDSNLINYYHLDFESGEWLKKIENL